MESALTTLPSVPKGTIKSFGVFGPKYEVGEPLRALEGGDWLIRIILIDTGEAAEYRYSHLLADPEAR